MEALVGAVTGGVAAARWSPDGEVLSLVSGQGQLLLMNKDWDTIAETWLFGSIENPIPARPLAAEAIPDSVWLGSDDVSLHWRGDGKFFATASRAQTGEPWVVRIWERESGALHAVGEHAPGLLGKLAWQPNGRNLYAACRQPDGALRVLLFERNGLQHGGFDDVDQEQHRVQIWQRINWHWYLKQELRPYSGSELHVAWSETALALDMVASNGTFGSVKFNAHTCVSERGTAAVIDGAKVLITPLGLAVVPPPLSAVVLLAPAPASCVAIRDFTGAEAIAMVLSDGRLAVISCLEEDDWEVTVETLAASGKPEGPDGLPACQIVIDPLDIQAAVSLPQGGALLQSGNGLLHKCHGGSLESLPAPDCFPEFCPVMCASPAGGELPPVLGLSDKGKLYWGPLLLWEDCTSFAVRAEGAGGPYLLFVTRDNVLHTLPFTSLLKPTDSSPQADTHKRPAARKQDGQARHYADMHAAMRGHGIASTSGRDASVRAVEAGSRLVAAPRGADFAVLQLPRGNLETVSPRALVLAALAHALLEDDYAAAWRLAVVNRVDLNLIVDYAWPRFLAHASDFVQAVVDDQAVCDLLAALRLDSVAAPGGSYASALPHPNPSTEAPQAVEEGKVAAVSRAVSDALVAIDAAAYLRPLVTARTTLGDIHGALQLIKDAKEAQLARDEAPQVNGTGEPGAAAGGDQAAAGAGFANGSGVELAGIGALGRWRRRVARAVPTAEDALRHLLLSVDVDRLFRSALEMYELELAFMVVAHSQRDPGEYMAQLQTFAALPPGPLRRHALDMHLGRWWHALHALLQAGDAHFDAALRLARDKGLLRELLGALPAGDARRAQVLEAYGEALAARNLTEDAALAFLAAGCLEQALARYKVAGQWCMAFGAGRLGWAAKQVQALAAELVEGLSGMGRPAEAATVAATHLHDIESAVHLFSQAHEWRQASYTAYQEGREDLIETVIAPAAADAAATLLSRALDDRKRTCKYLGRLKELREKRAAMEAALAAQEDGDADGAAADDMSDVSSVVSGLSAYTQHSAAATSGPTSTGTFAPSTVGGRRPQRRRQKGSKANRIRQGGPGEDKALAAHILELQPRAQQLAEAAQLCELLIMLGHEADARTLQQASPACMLMCIHAMQALSDLTSECEAAAAYILANADTVRHTADDKQSARQKEPAGTEMSWKWDILRPIKSALPSS
ncbi:IKI3-domain-containing protein [Coccomyxa subellipsoidea C-169]|uniref:Elongator complex protein 1 n=1 Tax=Coccomyxa subellipsoidea (strain C-169) TaxID=574566 RepID=I0Z5N1_COCSC|nr:IKI3-domain-containing protein [Coccomyxa subellipsoidea C-169]EIE25950.1 IKI3-domain-containing protein [Coccomyxa subellipsoidea C-169]|eukprot:XP_005650494.1 IKI3-domain-containing protein [Coccomyxa subellipsoidea C-169]